ncbi:MAG: helix-turn-helix transcriptional regulator [Lysobacter sp.]
MSDALSISPPPDPVAARPDGPDDADPADAAARLGARRRQVIERRQIELAEGVEFAVASENIARPTEWNLHHDRHTLIVHLDGAMRRLETRIEGAGRLHATPAAGDLWLIPAGRRYQGRALGGDIAYAELTINPAAYPGFGRASDDDAGLVPRMKHRDPFVHGLATRLAHLSGETDDLAAALRESLGQALCLHLLREHGAGSAGEAIAPVPAPRLSATARRRIEDYIQAHLDQRITLAALAGLAGLSTHRLLIAFRHSFGATPIQYVLAQRLHCARERLRSSDDDVGSIAIDTGFSSHSHLSALFKKRYGLTPSEYRLRG